MGALMDRSKFLEVECVVDEGKFLYPLSFGIVPIMNCNNFIKIRFVVAGGGLYLYYIYQGN